MTLEGEYDSIRMQNKGEKVRGGVILCDRPIVEPGLLSPVFVQDGPVRGESRYMHCLCVAETNWFYLELFNKYNLPSNYKTRIIPKLCQNKFVFLIVDWNI